MIRLIYLITAVCWYCLTLGGWLNRKKVVVLCYHGITAGQKNQFKWQMKKIANRAITLESMTNESNSSINKVCITFDDAFENLLENALPVLQELKIPALIFAVTDNWEKKPQWCMPQNHPEKNEMVMTTSQIYNVAQNPLFHIGSHTKTHPDLTKISESNVREELEQSKQYLENLLNIPIKNLALPHGAYNPDTINIAQAVGYKKVYTLNPNIRGSMKADSLIGRFSMSPDMSKIEYLLTCAGAYAWLGSLRQKIRLLRYNKK